MAIQRTDPKRQSGISPGASPVAANAAQAPASEKLSEAKPVQEARPASGTDSYSSARTPASGASAKDPTEQGFSIKEQRRAHRAAPSASGSAAAPPAAASEAAAPPAAEPEASILARAGHALGFGAGVVVTEALALVPGWNEPLLDASGKPVQSVPGAERIGDHDIEKRHQEVVGPQITALNEKIPSGPLHDLVGGFGAGATVAPGASYRIEAEVEDTLRGLWKKLTDD